MHRLNTPTASKGQYAEASTLPAVSREGDALGVSCAELAKLERELDLYLAFWAHARDGLYERPRNGERA
jgi:hypothetical protein